MRNGNLLLWLVFLTACSGASKTPSFKITQQQNIVENPAFASCHASTIVALPNNKIMAAWFAGPHESHKEVTIYTAVLSNGVWASPIEVADGVINDTLRYPCWNPVLFRTSAGRLILFYKVGPNPREWWGEMKYSYDDGITWSVAEKLPEGFLGPIKNKPMELADGSILYPSSTESLDEKTWHIHLEKSDSLQKNWTKINIDNDSFGVIQPSILSYENGDLQLLARSRQNYIIESNSTDNGASWTPLSKTNLPNPNAGSDAVSLKDGWQLLVYNPMPAGEEWWTGRNKLSVAVSNNGKFWEDVLVLEDQPKGEFSYPAVIQDEQGSIHITYTYDRKNIRYIKLN